MNIEPNMYVRTQKGIFRISHINIDFDDNDYRKVCLTQNELVGFASVDEIKKLKPTNNITDLIEVGDYVNGCMVINKKDDTIQIIQLIIPFDLKEKDIKSIVTKEMFANVEYKVGE